MALVPMLPVATAQPAVLNLDQFEIGTPINDLALQPAFPRSKSLMQAVTSVARADGHFDGEEMRLITQQIIHLGLEQDVTRFLLSEMGKPVDVQ